MTKTEVTTEATSRKPVYAKYFFNTLSGAKLKEHTLKIESSKIKDMTYFKRGLSYINLDILKYEVIEKIATAEKSLEKAETSEKQEFYAEKIETLNRLRLDILSKIDVLDLTYEERTIFDDDLFLRLHAIWFDKNYSINLGESVDDVIELLKKSEDNHIPDKDEIYALKDRMEEVAKLFWTKDSEYYENSYLHVTPKMAMSAYKNYADGVGIDKKGMVGDKWKAREEVSKLVTKILFAERQRKGGFEEVE